MARLPGDTRKLPSLPEMTWTAARYGQRRDRPCIRHARRHLFAGHNPDNDASRQLLQQLGFQYTHDEPYAPTGRMHPSYVLSAPREV